MAIYNESVPPKTVIGLSVKHKALISIAPGWRIAPTGGSSDTQTHEPRNGSTEQSTIPYKARRALMLVAPGWRIAPTGGSRDTKTHEPRRGST